MAYVETWDETKPAGSRDANLGDDDIREFKRAVRERLAGGGMNFPSTDDADAGLYNYVKFIEQSSNPTSESNRGFLFTKDVAGVTELYWMDSDGNVNQLTSAGKLYGASFTGLASIPSAAGVIPVANLASGTATGAKFVRDDGTLALPAFQVAATQAEMEAASSGSVPVTPANFQYHPLAPKAWCTFDGRTTGANAPSSGSNVATVTRNSQGNYTITFTNAFSAATYGLFCMGLRNDGAGGLVGRIVSRTTTTCNVIVADVDETVTDAQLVCLVFLGDQ